jgi:hypothetical protein
MTPRRIAALALAPGLVACQAILGLSDYEFEAVAANQPGACAADARRCDDDGVQTCAGGAWQPPVPCPSDQPLCSAGQCARLRVSGGLGTLPPLPPAKDRVRVVDARLEGVAASCGTWRGSPVCVHGRLAP